MSSFVFIAGPKVLIPGVHGMAPAQCHYCVIPDMRGSSRRLTTAPAPIAFGSSINSRGAPWRLKLFNATKGFGFIQPDAGGPDVFVHISAVERAGMGDLNYGQKIAYEIGARRAHRQILGGQFETGPESANQSRRAALPIRSRKERNRRQQT
jgi:cold shock protein